MQPEIKLKPLKDFLAEYELTIDEFENFIMNEQTIEELIFEKQR